MRRQPRRSTGRLQWPLSERGIRWLMRPLLLARTCYLAVVRRRMRLPGGEEQPVKIEPGVAPREVQEDEGPQQLGE
eukprot:4390096-Heterocapsa_arctica.AAC.1